MPLHTREYSQFLQELRAVREEAGVSQVELAKRINQDQSFVSKCEGGIRRLDVVELKQWTDALGIGLVGFANRLNDRLERNQAGPHVLKRKR